MACGDTQALNGVWLLLASGQLHYHRLLLLPLCFSGGDSNASGPLLLSEQIQWALSLAAFTSHAWSAPGMEADHSPQLSIHPAKEGWPPDSHPGLICLLPLFAICHLFLSKILDWVLHEQIFGSLSHHFAASTPI